MCRLPACSNLAKCLEPVCYPKRLPQASISNETHRRYGQPPDLEAIDRYAETVQDASVFPRRGRSRFQVVFNLSLDGAGWCVGIRGLDIEQVGRLRWLGG